MWSDIIDKAGGNLAVASALRVQPRAVSKWRKRGIPSRFWAEVAALARVDISAVKRPLWQRGGMGHGSHNGETVPQMANADCVSNTSFAGDAA